MAREMKPTKATAYMIMMTAIAVISGFPIGYHMAIISGAMLILRFKYNLSNQLQELIVSVTLAAAAVSALVTGWFNERFGRKKVIIASSLIFLVGTCIMAAADDKYTLLAGRLVLGIAIGSTGSTVPAYLAETTPTHLRGFVLALFPVLVTLGQWVSGILAAALSYIQDSNISWRLMIGLGGVTVIVQLFLLPYLAESPHWLANNGRTEEAHTVLLSIYGDDDNGKAITKALLEESEVRKSSSETNEESGKFKILKNREARKALLIGCALQMIQQLSGVNCVMFYAASIMKMSGIKNDSTAMWLGSLSGMTNFIGTAIGSYLLERAGRRIAVLWSTAGNALISAIALNAGSILGLLFISISFSLIAHNSLPGYYDESTFMEGRYKSMAENDSCFGLSNNPVNYLYSCDSCSYETDCGFCYIPDAEDMNSTGSCISTMVTDGQRSTNQALYGRCSVINANTSVDNFADLLFMEAKAVFDYGYCSTPYSWLPAIGLVIFVLSFAFGKIFRRRMGTQHRKCNCCFHKLAFLPYHSAYVSFPFVRDYKTSFIFMYLFLPETKGVPLDNIEELLKEPWIQKKK
ncbi:proton myo inositol cotransporter [Trichuris trichiura]|uniref:Proton myo inositol cotransporter n=1 Tax=Trichuris trichiura TaxID=36087 RepID=A0A077Z9G9_TRITR|nr:proton myo inositol cotransporter [Trichuris trichiura]